VLDNLDRALGAEGSDASLREGVELTRRELLAILESQGVKLEDPMGQPFDPERHQALAHEPVPGVPEGTVVEVYRKGYSYRDRLLRPALVKVAAASGAHKVH
jgi:molecular chaperone GrpE